MKLNKSLKVFTVWLLVLCLFSSNIRPAIAEKDVEVQSDDYVGRLSNPDNEPGQPDGLVQGGNRTAGYGWALAERGDYLYIGTWNNIGGQILNSFVLPRLNQYGDYTDLFWAISDILTNGDIPRDDVGRGGEIIRMNKNNPGDFETVYKSNFPFRKAIVYGDDIYFSTYAPAQIYPACIVKLDIDDNVSTIYQTYQGSSMRAGTVYNDKLYYGGAYAPAAEDYDPNHANITVIEKHTEDDGWDMVADDEDFGAYCNDAMTLSAVASPVWDMTVFNDELYVSLPGNCGYVIFAGHPAEDGEEANKYGWSWREIVGRENGVNYPGNANNVENQEFIYNEDGYYDDGEAGFLSVAGAMVVFNDELYVYDSDNVLMAELSSALCILNLILKQDAGNASSYLLPLYNTINHPQHLWKLEDDGSFSEVTGFTELMTGTCNEYVWSSAVYDDTLYLGTMDSKVITNYLTRLTGASLFDMSAEEWHNEIDYIKNLLTLLDDAGYFGEDGLPWEDINNALDKFLAFVDWYDALGSSIDGMTISEFLSSLFPTEEEAYAMLEMAKQGSEEFAEKTASISEKLNTIKDYSELLKMAPDLLFPFINLYADEEMLPYFPGFIDVVKQMVINKISSLENENIDKDKIISAIESIDSEALANFLQPIFASLVASEGWEEKTAAFSEAWQTYVEKGLDIISISDEFIGLLSSVNGDIPWDDIADLIDLVYDNTIAEDLGESIAGIGNLTLGMAKNYVRSLINKMFDNIDAKPLENALSLISLVDSMDEETIGSMIQTSLPALLDVAFDNMLDKTGENEEINALIEGLRQSVEGIIENLSEDQLASLASIIKSIAGKLNFGIDGDAIEMYLGISKIVRDDVQGFDIVKTTDGENFEVVTNDGFGDKWNYGALRFLSTEDGVYITTANPFYGTQLYQLSHDHEIEDDPEEDSYDDFADYSINIRYISGNYDFFHEGYGELSFDVYPDLKKGTVYSRFIDSTTNYVSTAEYDDMPIIYYYSDHFFDFPSTEFNPHLNTLSTILSSASIASHRADGSDTEREAEDIDHNKYKSRNIQEMLYYMGFDDIYVNEDYTTEPGLDTVGLVMANKKITDAEGNESTLVLLTPRNAGYLSEWYNNFDIGSSGNHQGFQSAAEKAYAQLLDYIKSQGITGDIKLWLAGTSRGAGITNVLSGILDDSEEIAALGIEKEEIYSYNIGSPRAIYIFDEEGNSKKLHSEKYYNIKNVYYDFDMVSSILTNEDNGKGWNFERYGEDIVLSMGDEADEYDLEYNEFLGILDNFLNQMLVLNPYCTYFGEDQIPEQYLPLNYKEVSARLTMAQIPEILEIALSEGKIDDETYLEMVQQYSEILSSGMNFIYGFIGGESTDMSGITDTLKDVAAYFAKLVQLVGADTIAKNLLKPEYGVDEKSNETFAHALKRFNKTFANSVNREIYGEKYNDAIATFVDVVQYLDKQDLDAFTGSILTGLTGILTDVKSNFNKLIGKEEETNNAESMMLFSAEDNKNINKLLSLEEDEKNGKEIDYLEKAKIAADLLSSILQIETNAANIIIDSGNNIQTLPEELKGKLTTDNGKALIRYLLRIATASIRFPGEFGNDPLESINALSSFASGVSFMFASHDAGVFISFARVYDSFYNLENECETNPYNDINRVTDYEKLGYRNVLLPENEGLKFTVKQVNTSDGSNSKVDNGVVLEWNKEDGVTSRMDPSVFVNTYENGSENAVVSYDSGTYLFLPLDHEYEITVTTDQKAEFDLPVFEHSLLGTYKVETLLRTIDSDENSPQSHKGIVLDTCDTLKMKAEGFDKSVVALALYGDGENAPDFLIPFSSRNGAAYYPIEIQCEKTEPAPVEPAADEPAPAKKEETSPKTADGTNPYILLFASVLSLAGIIVIRKKENLN